MSLAAESNSAARPSDRELVLLRALAAVTGSTTPEISLGEFALKIGVGRPTKELWRLLENLAAKGFVCLTPLPGWTGAPVGAEDVATHVRLRLHGDLQQALDIFFSRLFEPHLGFADDGVFLGALAAWVESEFARRTMDQERRSAPGPGGAEVCRQG